MLFEHNSRTSTIECCVDILLRSTACFNRATSLPKKKKKKAIVFTMDKHIDTLIKFDCSSDKWVF